MRPHATRPRASGRPSRRARRQQRCRGCRENFAGGQAALLRHGTRLRDRVGCTARCLASTNPRVRGRSSERQGHASSHRVDARAARKKPGKTLTRDSGTGTPLRVSRSASGTGARARAVAWICTLFHFTHCPSPGGAGMRGCRELSAEARSATTQIRGRLGKNRGLTKYKGADDSNDRDSSLLVLTFGHRSDARHDELCGRRQHAASRVPFGGCLCPRSRRRLQRGKRLLVASRDLWRWKARSGRGLRRRHRCRRAWRLPQPVQRWSRVQQRRARWLRLRGDLHPRRDRRLQTG
jgi:hypothetical protein